MRAAFRVFVISRKAHWFPAVVAVWMILLALCPVALTAVPLRDGVRVNILRISTLVPAIALAVFLQSPGRQVEALPPQRSLRGFRLALTVAILAITLAATAIVIGARSLGTDLMIECLRNTAGGIGLSCLVAAFLAREGTWIALCLVGAVTWMFGSTDMLGTPKSWALLSQPWDSPSSAVAAVALVAVGLTVFSLRGDSGR
jgi:hypothetical protein